MNNLAVVQDNVIAPLVTAQEMQQQVNAIQHVMKQVMKKDTHYGVIPGTQQPTLYKPGAEKIAATFRLAADPEVEDVSTPDEARYRVKVRLLSINGYLVGAGIGECSSNEEKYKWRNAVCKEEFDETPDDRKREKWNKGYGGKPAYKRQQVRTNHADLANTVLKMAKKRALVDAVLTATAASDIFTQDVEDLPAEYRETATEQRRTAPAGVKDNQPDTPERKALIDELDLEASKGMQALINKWQSYTDKQRGLVGAAFGEIKAKAQEAASS